MNKIQEVVNDDCIKKIKEMKAESVDIIICDPPYNIGKDFGNNSDKQKMDVYLKWCDEWIKECIRVLKPTGTLYIYGFSEILSFIRVRININVRWIIWHYTNKTVPRLNFWQRTHESILCCYKEKPVFNRDDVREPYTKGFLKNTPFQVPVGENVLFGFKSNKSPNLMEYLFTTKGVYIMNNPKLMPYSKVSFKHNLLTTIGHNRVFGLQIQNEKRWFCRETYVAGRMVFYSQYKTWS